LNCQADPTAGHLRVVSHQSTVPFAEQVEPKHSPPLLSSSAPAFCSSSTPLEATTVMTVSGTGADATFQPPGSRALPGGPFPTTRARIPAPPQHPSAAVAGSLRFPPLQASRPSPCSLASVAAVDPHCLRRHPRGLPQATDLHQALRQCSCEP
jgi:hypothetical protein